MLPLCKVVEPFTFFACLNYDKAVASLGVDNNVQPWVDNNVQQGRVFFTHCILKTFCRHYSSQQHIQAASHCPIIKVSYDRYFSYGICEKLAKSTTLE